ncbi:hypothetical protein N9948_00210 [bacterium]|nr:hypothetical protein [bacterium]
MGCFNVACSVSNISINSGDRVVYIPLLPNNWTLRAYPQYRDHIVQTASSLIYSNCYYNPLCFPIKGEYNDYGSLENIDQNANTKAIENFFGMSAEDFVKSAERNWCRSYIDDQKLIGENFIKEFKEFNNVSDDDLSDKFMLKMGFEKTKEGMYTFKKLPYKVEIIKGKGKEGYHILELESGEKAKSREHNGFYKNYLLADMAELTGYYIGISDEFQNKIKIMENLSGMFIHEDIYNELVSGKTRASGPPSCETLEELGFVLDSNKKGYWKEDIYYYHPEVEDQSSFVAGARYASAHSFDKDSRDSNYGDYIRSTYQLADEYIEKHGVIFDLRDLEKESIHSENFNKLQTLVKEYRSNKKISSKERERLTKLLKKDLGGAELDRLYNTLYTNNPLERGISTSDLARPFEDWPYFSKIYTDSFEKGDIKKDYCDWLSASSSMYSCNVFFFPAMNGEQHGNDFESKRLYEKSLEIINKRIQKYREENEEDGWTEEYCN